MKDYFSFIILSLEYLFPFEFYIFVLVLLAFIFLLKIVFYLKNFDKGL